LALTLLDSSTVIAIQRSDDAHHKKAVAAVAALAKAPTISAITLSEVLVRQYRQSPDLADLAAARLAGAFYAIYPVSPAITMKAAVLRAQRDLGLADSLISATALLEGAQLWTCDKALAKAHPGARLIG
jgi:predicted nucleic acid-binding protein